MCGLSILAINYDFFIYYGALGWPGPVTRLYTYTHAYKKQTKNTMKTRNQSHQTHNVCRHRMKGGTLIVKRPVTTLHLATADLVTSNALTSLPGSAVRELPDLTGQSLHPGQDLHLPGQEEHHAPAVHDVASDIQSLMEEWQSLLQVNDVTVLACSEDVR